MYNIPQAFRSDWRGTRRLPNPETRESQKTSAFCQLLRFFLLFPKEGRDCCASKVLSERYSGVPAYLIHAPIISQVVIVVDEIMWTGNLGSSILRVQQSGSNAVPDSAVLDNALESLPQDGNFMAEGDPKEAVANFLDYSLTQIEAMIDFVRGNLNRLETQITSVRTSSNLTVRNYC